MKNKIYIIPALGDTCADKPYRKLTKALEEKGLDVVPVHINWYKPISEQTFMIEPQAMIFGFSFGAVIAYLTAKKYTCKKAILASLSPIHTFTKKSLVDDMLPYMNRAMAERLADDIKRINTRLPIKAQQVRLAGELEDIGPANVIVPHTGHTLSREYITAVVKEVC